MIVFFIVLTILLFLSILFWLLCLSNLEIEINRFCLNSNNKKNEKLESFLFYIRVKLFGKITWFKIKIDNKKINDIKSSKFLISKMFNRFKDIQKIVFKNKQKILKKDNIKYIKKLSIKFKKLDLYMQLCTLSTIFTPFIITTISSLLSIILAKNIEKYDRNKYKYIIMPKYEDKPSLKINLNCIIDIKIVHIINIIYILIKKRRVVSDERTSNRRTYASIND